MLGVTVALALGTMLTGCGDEHSAAPSPPPSSSLPIAAYDPTLPPPQAVLALVPAGATELRLTDFDRIKDEFGTTELTSASPAAEQAAFWKRAHDDEPMLTSGLLRPVDAQLRSGYGFGALDVAWEASFDGGATQGWAIRIADHVPMASVQRAVRAGVGPLKGAKVDAAAHLVTRGAAAPGQPNWASQPGLEDLVGPESNATYVGRQCLPGATGAQRLADLTAYAVDFGSLLATARLGAGRDDLFERLRLGAALPAFSRVFTKGVADPTSGRIGFNMTNAPAAADLTLRHRLPFAVCAS